MWNTIFELALCRCVVSDCGVCFAAFDVVCDVFDNGVCGMFVRCSLCVSVCMLTVSNALLMFSATVIVRLVVCFG